MKCRTILTATAFAALFGFGSVSAQTFPSPQDPGVDIKCQIGLFERTTVLADCEITTKNIEKVPNPIVCFNLETTCTNGGILRAHVCGAAPRENGASIPISRVKLGTPEGGIGCVEVDNYDPRKNWMRMTLPSYFPKGMSN